MALKKGMYDDGSERFGLREAQMRVSSEKCAHNAGWYNAAGERLGWGDLSFADLAAIAAGLEEGDVFIVLPEVQAHFAFVFPRRFRWVGRRRTADAPGPAYVRRHAQYAVVKGRPYAIDRHADVPEGGYARKGVRIGRMTEDGLKKLMRRRRR